MLHSEFAANRIKVLQLLNQVVTSLHAHSCSFLIENQLPEEHTSELVLLKQQKYPPVRLGLSCLSLVAVAGDCPWSWLFQPEARVVRPRISTQVVRRMEVYHWGAEGAHHQKSLMALSRLVSMRVSVTGPAGH